ARRMDAGSQGRGEAARPPETKSFTGKVHCEHQEQKCRDRLGARPQKAPMNPAKRRKIFERLRAANPNPTTDLLYGSPFELLVAVVLSAQATDKSVNLATRQFFPATPDQLVALGVKGIEERIKTIGLFRTKAKNVFGLSKII